MNGISSSRNAWRGLPAFLASMSASSSAFASIRSASFSSAARALAGRRGGPAGQRLARGGDRRVDVLDRRLRHLGHRLAGCGIQDFQSHASTSVTVSIRLPRRSSSGKSASGSMHCSGGSAPRASTAPRASSLTAAAAGAAVETMPPPRPHSSCGGVKDVTRAERPPAVASIDVRGHGLRGRRRARARPPRRAPRRRRRRARAAARAARARATGGSSPRGSRSSPGTCASPSGSCGSSRPRRSDRRTGPSRPARIGSTSTGSPSRITIGFIVSSSTSV